MNHKGFFACSSPASIFSDRHQWFSIFNKDSLGSSQQEVRPLTTGQTRIHFRLVCSSHQIQMFTFVCSQSRRTNKCSYKDQDDFRLVCSSHQIQMFTFVSSQSRRTNKCSYKDQDSFPNA